MQDIKAMRAEAILSGRTAKGGRAAKGEAAAKDNKVNGEGPLPQAEEAPKPKARKTPKPKPVSKKAMLSQLDATEARWFAVYTRFKREKIVEAQLDEGGVQHFLPLIEHTRHYPSKRKVVKIPLISCYIFVKITVDDYVKVLEIPDVLNFVRLGKRLIAIPEAEIDMIRRVIGEYQDAELTESRLTVGDEVEIIAGNLTGLRGCLTKQAGKNKFVIELKNIGHALLIEVKPSALKRVRAYP